MKIENQNLFAGIKQHFIVIFSQINELNGIACYESIIYDPIFRFNEYLTIKQLAMKTETFLKDYQFALEKRLTETHKQQLKQSCEKGEEDGKRNLPSVDDDFTTPVEF